MPCEVVRIDGGVAILCGRGRRRRTICGVCGARPATRLCDGPAGPADRARSRRTCDEPLCGACAVKTGAGEDYCPRHIPAWGRQLDLFGTGG